MELRMSLIISKFRRFVDSFITKNIFNNFVMKKLVIYEVPYNSMIVRSYDFSSIVF